MSPGESGAMEKNHFLSMTTGPACQYKIRALILGEPLELRENFTARSLRDGPENAVCGLYFR
jgi:hypothetical protein